MKTIAIFNQKGGVGKTTVASMLACGLTLQGYKVLCIDLDHQCNLTDFAEVTRNNKTAYELLTGKMRAVDVIQSTGRMGDIIAGNKALAVANNAIHSDTQLKDTLDAVKEKYDYILIDTHPLISTVTINALTASNSIIIPTGADKFSWTGIQDLIESLEMVKEILNPSLTVEGILITRANERTSIHKGMIANLQTLAKRLDSKVFNTVIRESVIVRDAQFDCKSVFETAPKSKVANDFAMLIKELTA